MFYRTLSGKVKSKGWAFLTSEALTDCLETKVVGWRANFRENCVT